METFNAYFNAYDDACTEHARAVEALASVVKERDRWERGPEHAALKLARAVALAAIKAGSRGAPAARSAVEADYRAAYSAKRPSIVEAQKRVCEAYAAAYQARLKLGY